MAAFEDLRARFIGQGASLARRSGIVCMQERPTHPGAHSRFLDGRPDGSHGRSGRDVDRADANPAFTCRKRAPAR